MTKYKIYIIGIGIAIIIGLFSAWRITSTKLANTEKELAATTCQLTTLQEENQKLSEYNKKKDTEIKNLQDKYKQQLQNIPTDVCGDTKPSKELLEYFKNGGK